MHPDPLREHILALLSGRGAHADFDAVVKNFPAASRGVKPAGSPHSAWQLLEHIRIAQHDILEFCLKEDYEELKWPDDYWPPTEAPPDNQAWNHSVAEVRRELEEMKRLVQERDLFAPVPSDPEKTLLREVLLVADHNAYHIGQLMLVRRILGD